MTHNETNNIYHNPPQKSEKELLKTYQKPRLTILETLDIGTGSVNVPEGNNGLIS